MKFKKWIFYFMILVTIVILYGILFTSSISDKVGIPGVVAILGYFIWYFKPVKK